MQETRPHITVPHAVTLEELRRDIERDQRKKDVLDNWLYELDGHFNSNPKQSL